MEGYLKFYQSDWLECAVMGREINTNQVLLIQYIFITDFNDTVSFGFPDEVVKHVIVLEVLLLM